MIPSELKDLRQAERLPIIWNGVARLAMFCGYAQAERGGQSVVFAILSNDGRVPLFRVTVERWE